MFNPYAKVFKNFSKSNVPNLTLRVHDLDAKNFYRPTVKQVAAVVKEGTEGNPRDIVLTTKNNELRTISW